MRWFCVAPALPNKAVLRIRTAPNSDADVCGRFSKGKAVAAFANVVDIRDESDPDSVPQKWLHVAFQDEHTGRWSQGYVMASLPDGMTLLVPWEEAGFIRCCNIDEARAILYDSAAMNAQIVGTVDAGEGTRFAYGVEEAAGHRLRIFHDVYDSVWVNADDTDTVCEKIDHPNCRVPHSYFQVVEAQARCGNWLQVVGADSQDAWIMWQTNTLQLLTELPFHTAGGCQLTTPPPIESSMEAEPLEPLESTDVEESERVGVEAEENEAETDAATNGEQRPFLAVHDSSLPSDQDDAISGVNETTAACEGVPSEAKPTFEVQKSPVTNLCDELASNGISSLEEVLTSSEEPVLEANSSTTVRWEEMPLNGNRQHENSEVVGPHHSFQDVNQADEIVEEDVQEPPKPAPMSSWEDRPITAKGQGSYSLQFDESAESSATETQPKESSYSWEDRPIAAKSSGAYSWESSLGEKEESSGPSHIASEPQQDEEQFAPEKGVAVSQEATEVQEVDPDVQDIDDDEGNSEATDEQVVVEVSPTVAEDSVKVTVMPWDEVPIKSRHAQEAAAKELEVDGSPAKLTPSKRALDAEERPWNTSARRTPTRQVDSVATSAERNGSASSPKSPTLPAHPAVGVVAATNGSVTWHSNDASEDPGAFADSGVFEAENSTTPLQHSPRAPHASHSAVGVVSSDNAISWHSVDAVECTEDGDAMNENEWSTGEAGDEDDGDRTAPVDPASPIEVDEDHEYYHQEATQEDMEDDAEFQDAIGEAEPRVDVIEKDHDDNMNPDPVITEHNHLHEREDEAMAGEATLEEFGGPHAESIVFDNEFAADSATSTTTYAEDGHLTPPSAGPIGIQSRLMTRLTGLASDRQDRILKAIAFNEGPDAILEALASADNYDEDLLKYSPPPGPPATVAPSPSTSESGLLDVLYSRDQGDAFSTPTKKRPLGASNQASAKTTYSAENKTEILAGILRRTPQKSRESHNKIVGNANPEEILEAEFGSCADELGLFGDYRYPTVAPTRFSSGNFGTPTRAASLSMSSLPSPSFGTAASFASPVAKENPLKRSASAIAKTPPVNLAKAAAAPKRVESPPPPPPPPVQKPAPIQVPEKTIPVRSRTPSGLVPPGAKSGIATGLPRPTLVSPSIATSQLRRPGTSALLSPTGASRPRSFTASDEVKERASLPSAPAAGLARAQSMLPRRSMLPAPSPSKLAAPSPMSRFGLTRTTSLSSTAPSAAATPAAATASATASTTPSLLSRRTSFGFSRPTPTKKT